MFVRFTYTTSIITMTSTMIVTITNTNIIYTHQEAEYAQSPY